jgi:hypothetical protein
MATTLPAEEQQEQARGCTQRLIGFKHDGAVICQSSAIAKAARFGA